MIVSRRHFLSVGAGAAAALAAGCDKAEDARAELFRFIGRPTAPPLEGPFTAPGDEAIDGISHLLNRLTFGPRPGDYGRVGGMGREAFIAEQLAPEKIDDWQCDRVLRHECAELGEPESRFFPRRAEEKDPLQQLFPALKSHGARVGDLYEYKEPVLLRDLTRATLFRSLLSKRQLFERMVEFWSDHFNVDPSKGESKWLKAADDRDVIRAHALGNFREMVRASALSPAMLWYLDGRVNQSRSPGEKPNENYARELMELHTLGVHGGYTQKDVMEIARCLTGWTVRDQHQWQKGKVEFKQELHDDRAKIVLGEAIPAGLGAADLDRVLEIVVRHPSTARHIAAKLCRYFIADEPRPVASEAVAKAFQESGGDIRATLRALFSTADFDTARGIKLKRPFHFVVSALRAANAETDAGEPIVNALLRMGHAPFRYPTPDGYPETASHWTNTLLWRWNFSAALAANALPGTRVDEGALRTAVGGDEALMACAIGRRATAEELRACQESGAPLGLIFASPAFQRC